MGLIFGLLLPKGLANEQLAASGGRKDGGTVAIIIGYRVVVGPGIRALCNARPNQNSFNIFNLERRNTLGNASLVPGHGAARRVRLRSFRRTPVHSVDGILLEAVVEFPQVDGKLL